MKATIALATTQQTFQMLENLIALKQGKLRLQNYAFLQVGEIKQSRVLLRKKGASKRLPIANDLNINKSIDRDLGAIAGFFTT